MEQRTRKMAEGRMEQRKRNKKQTKQCEQQEHMESRTKNDKRKQAKRDNGKQRTINTKKEKET